MTDLMEAVTSLAKRRGIAFQSAEIYGGLRSSWDYGPLGVELRRNIRNAWWRSKCSCATTSWASRPPSSRRPRVWEASGHLETFHDPLVECTNCHQRFREDHLKLQTNADGVVLCPNCGGAEFTEPKQFNLMFKTFMGPVEDDDAIAYLRPETAQGMFVNFPAIQTVGAQEAARSASRRSASRSATRSRRGTSSSARASSSRWRWSSSSSPAPTTSGSTYWVERAPAAGTWTSASRRRSSACARTRPRSSPTTRRPPPTSSTSSRSAGRSSRASRTAPTST